MTDEVSPVESQPAPAPPPPADADFPLIDSPISTGNEVENVRQSVRELNAQRQRDGTAVEPSRDPLPLRWLDSEPKSLRTATRDVSDYHRLEKDDAQFLRGQGWSKADILRLAKDESWLRSTGLSAAEANQFARSGEMPPIKVGLVDDREGLRPQLREFDKIDRALNLKDATRELGNYREVAARAQQDLLAEIEGAEQQQAQQARAAQEQAAAQQQAAAQAAQARAGQQRAAAYQQQLAAAAHWQQLSAAERTAAHELRQMQQWTLTASPQEIATWEGPATARANQLRQELAQAQTLRQAHQVQAAHAHQAQRAQWGKYQDQVYSANLAHHLPHFASPEGRKQLQTSARNLGRSVGLSDAQMNYLWNGGALVDLRDARAQTILAKAAAYDSAVAQLKAIGSKHAPLPAVLRPGVHRPAGSGDADEVRRLERQLETATGNQSLKIATRLTQAKRRLNGGY